MGAFKRNVSAVDAKEKRTHCGVLVVQMVTCECNILAQEKLQHWMFVYTLKGA